MSETVTARVTEEEDKQIKAIMKNEKLNRGEAYKKFLQGTNSTVSGPQITDNIKSTIEEVVADTLRQNNTMQEDINKKHLESLENKANQAEQDMKDKMSFYENKVGELSELVRDLKLERDQIKELVVKDENEKVFQDRYAQLYIDSLKQQMDKVASDNQRLIDAIKESNNKKPENTIKKTSEKVKEIIEEQEAFNELLKTRFGTSVGADTGSFKITDEGVKYFSEMASPIVGALASVLEAYADNKRVSVGAEASKTGDLVAVDLDGTTVYMTPDDYTEYVQQHSRTVKSSSNKGTVVSDDSNYKKKKKKSNKDEENIDDLINELEKESDGL